MTVMLYDHPLSPYAQKVKIALMEKNVPYTAPLPMGIGSGTSTNDFAQASPRGEVPALIDGDVKIFDSTIILEYIEDRWPTPSLLPATPEARARARMIEDVMDTHFEAITWGMSEIINFGRAEGALKDKMLTEAAAQLRRWMTWLQTQLGSAPWFGGEHFDRADLSVIPYVNGAAGFGVAPTPGSSLAAWHERANARASVTQCREDIAAMARVTDPTAGLAQVREMVKRGEFKREYRDHRLEWMIKTGGIDVVTEGIAHNNIRFINEFTV